MNAKHPTQSSTLVDLRANTSLGLAGIYNRVVNASINRVWENVFDWEHLPALHEAYFSRIELLQRFSTGWRVSLTSQPGDATRTQIVELVADRDAGDYCVHTLEGLGTGAQIWTRLQALDAHRTAVEVRYLIPEQRPERLATLGEKYRAMYHRLWDEDEAMMQRRECLLSQPPKIPSVQSGPLSLGDITEVRAKLPLMVEFAGRPFRVLELAGTLVAHSTVCPHWLGPLDEAPVVDGCIRCPWHGYQFDVRSGASTDGRGLRLAQAPEVRITQAGEVMLVGAET